MVTPNLELKEAESVGLNLISEPLPQQSTVNNETEKQQEIQPATNSQEAIDDKLLDKYTNGELTVNDLDAALSITIYEDKNVKIPLLLTGLLTFTKEEQRNVVLTSESSVGKTHNISECLWYFRQENSQTIVEINDATPRALIFSPNAIPVDDRTLQPIDLSTEPQKGDPIEVWNEWNDLKRHTAYFLDLANKIVVFYDLKTYDLLQNLRSLLSHDYSNFDSCPTVEITNTIQELFNHL